MMACARQVPAAPLDPDRQLIDMQRAHENVGTLDASALVRVLLGAAAVRLDDQSPSSNVSHSIRNAKAWRMDSTEMWCP